MGSSRSCGHRYSNEDGVVVSGRTNRVFLEPVHRFAEALIGLDSGSRSAAHELRFGAVLGQDAAVIGALILAFNSAQNLFRLGVAQP